MTDCKILRKNVIVSFPAICFREKSAKIPIISGKTAKKREKRPVDEMPDAKNGILAASPKVSAFRGSMILYPLRKNVGIVPVSDSTTPRRALTASVLAGRLHHPDLKLVDIVVVPIQLRSGHRIILHANQAARLGERKRGKRPRQMTAIRQNSARFPLRNASQKKNPACCL